MKIARGNWTLKKINSIVQPNELSEFALIYPNGSWDGNEPSFKQQNAGSDYQLFKQKVFACQNSLCAYCEVKIDSEKPHKQRIEHFHSKSDSTEDNNWDLDWQNVFGVCLGGSDVDAFPLPANLSCDAFKQHAIEKGMLDVACEGYVLNPLSIEPLVNLFRFDKATGQLQPNEQACHTTILVDNHFTSTAQLVANTIKVFNLNCDRLVQQRKKLLHLYNAKMKKAREANDRQWQEKLAQQWLSKPWQAFFTTRRCLLKDKAEQYLTQIAFNG